MYIIQARNSMQEVHDLQEEKLLLSQMKSKTVVEKVQRKSMKRASKHGSSSDQENRNKRELNQLVTEQEVKVRILRSQRMRSREESYRSQK